MWWLFFLCCCVAAGRTSIAFLKEYDFIVVGAGPAGSVVANRLTENPHWNVLLLEAGTIEDTYSENPALSVLFPREDYRRNFKTEPSQTACLSQPDHSCTLPTGKAVGGGTVVNAMMYVRGNRNDYDTWHKLGNKGWSYDEILKYFLKSEDIKIRDLQCSPYHSNNGNLTVDYTPFQIPLNKVFLEAGMESRLPYTDYNGAESIGVATMQTTKRKGRRVSAFKAFLEPVKARNNLHIRHSTEATRILIDPVIKTAYGVEFVGDNNVTSWVIAKKEVILSAGAIMSPFLLMHSGIGHQDHLKEMGIPVIKNLPVGDNLQDHLVYPGTVFLINDFSLSVNYAKNVITNLRNLTKEWENNGDNVLSSIGIDSLAFVKSSLNEANSYPDLELLFVYVPTGSQQPANIYNTVYKPIADKPQYSIWPMILKPKSRGHIRLKSSDRMEDPKVTTNYLQNKEDVRTMVEGIKRTIKISQTEALQKIGSRLHDIPIPGCENFTFASDSYWECVVRHLSRTIYHYCGTCRMGPVGDPAAVVDPRLKVHGVHRLRVVDISIVPEIPSGHTAAAAYMIGEKAADMIKDDWNFFQHFTVL